MVVDDVVGYDTSVIGGTMALDSFRRHFGLIHASDTETDTLEGNIVSTFQAGCFFGSLLTFPLGERFGRRNAIVMAVCVFCIGGSLMVRDTCASQADRPLTRTRLPRLGIWG